MAAQFKIWLVGLTGNGKSSTGNTILQGENFSLYSNEISVKSGLVFGDRVLVIDGSGIGDCAEDLHGEMSALVDSVETIFSVTLQKWFSALVIVVKFGVRFTRQEAQAIEIIKDIFGDDVFKKCGIIVVTYGDNFDKEQMTETFNDWCRKQELDFKNLLIECDYRCVLFNNTTQIVNEKKKMVDQLMGFVRKVQTYNESDFREAKDGRTSLKQKQVKDSTVEHNENNHPASKRLGYLSRFCKFTAENILVFLWIAIIAALISVLIILAAKRT